MQQRILRIIFKPVGNFTLRENKKHISLTTMKTKIPKFKASALKKKLRESMGAINEIIAERDEAIETMERIRKWDLLPHGRKKGKLPSPRIQFEHIPSTDGWATSWCAYWLVLPLNEFDIRREENDKKPYDEWFIPVGETKTSGRNNLPVYGGVVQTPYRNGAHAHFDREALGLKESLPIYATCGDEFTLIEEKAKDAAK